MKENNSGMSSLEIIAYVIIALASLFIITGVFCEIKEVANVDNSVLKRWKNNTYI